MRDTRNTFHDYITFDVVHKNYLQCKCNTINERENTFNVNNNVQAKWCVSVEMCLLRGLLFRSKKLFFYTIYCISF